MWATNRDSGLGMIANKAHPGEDLVLLLLGWAVAGELDETIALNLHGLWDTSMVAGVEKVTGGVVFLDVGGDDGGDVGAEDSWEVLQPSEDFKEPDIAAGEEHLAAACELLGFLPDGE